MEVLECINKRNSIRRFVQDQIEDKNLQTIIDAARIAPSAANLQPLEYIIINKQEQCASIFPNIGWAGYIKPIWKPEKHERPTAYVAIINTQPKNSYVDLDVGIAMAYIVLSAKSLELDSCILCKINKKELKHILKIPDFIELKALIALGKRNETVQREENINEVKYWRDKKEILHVPKKPLSSIIHEQFYNKI
ncbi:nitroreductase [Thermoplasmatales archaeon ex4572_165]|nr:MAG: nitroreductase [Thermoplasmatales archaeon ex4572_165]RLF57393.1 MAG: nitroreductase [Thermoplasmata archaeon]